MQVRRTLVPLVLKVLLDGVMALWQEADLPVTVVELVRHLLPRIRLLMQWLSRGRQDNLLMKWLCLVSSKIKRRIRLGVHGDSDEAAEAGDRERAVDLPGAALLVRRVCRPRELISWVAWS